MQDWVRGEVLGFGRKSWTAVRVGFREVSGEFWPIFQHRECGPSGVNAHDLRRVMSGWAKEPRNTHVKTMSKGTMKVQYMTAVREIMSIKVLIFESTRMNKPPDC